MNAIIERAKPTDAALILEYLKQIGGETDFLSFGAEGLPFSVEQETEYLEQIKDSSNELMLVAKVDGKIVGNASLSRLPRRMSHRGEVSVSVVRTYWNRGIGTRLLEKLIDFSREYSLEILELQVRSDHFAAIHLYEKLGFQKIGTHPTFFKIDQEYFSFDYMCLNLNEWKGE